MTDEQWLLTVVVAFVVLSIVVGPFYTVSGKDHE